MPHPSRAPALPAAPSSRRLRSIGNATLLLTLASLLANPGWARAQNAQRDAKVDSFYGNFQDSVSIAAPSYHGIEPGLALEYSSSAGNGMLGVGWRLGGFTSIERANPGRGTPRFDANDIYLLGGGEELVPCTTLGGTHCTRIQSFLRIRFDATANTWTVWQKNGTRIEYRAIYAGSGGTYRWGISSVTDVHGNAVSYSWSCVAGGDCYPDTIGYNGTSIRFYRETRPDPVTFATGSGLGRTDDRLKTIDVTVGGQRVRTYALRYGQSTATGSSYLTEVRQYGRDATLDASGTVTGGTSLPPRTFGLASGTRGFTPSYASGLWLNNTPSWDLLGDFNGDGKTDIMGVAVANSAGSSAAYVNYATGSGFTTAYHGSMYLNSTPGWNLLGDFNGDGKTDVMAVWVANSAGSSAVYVNYSTGSGFVPVYHGGLYLNNTAVWDLLGDFNGDGKTDIMGVWVANSAGSSTAYVNYSTGTGFSPAYHSGLWLNNTPGWNHLGDFNGDGKTDIMGVAVANSSGSSGGYVNYSTGTGFSPAYHGGMYLNNTAAWDPRADFNGDGKTDYMGVWVASSASNSAVYLNNSTAPLDLVTTIGNGRGGTTTLQYQPSSVWANTYLPSGLILATVASVTANDGRGASSVTSYQYQGGLWSGSERRFLGFRKVTTVLDAAGNYTETYYHQHVGCIAKPEVTYYRAAGGSLYRYSTFGYSENSTPPYTSLMTDRWEYECNLSASCRRTLLQVGYDQYGNGYLTYEYGDYDTPGDERTSLRGLYPNTTAYLVGQPAYENVYAGIGTGGALLKQTLYEYDGNATYAAAPSRGLIARQKAWNNQTGGYITRGFGYDAWGNRTSETDERGYTSTTAYDPVDHVHETRRCNALAQCATNVWDSGLDLLRSETDINGNLTAYTYDALGRPVETRLADGTTQTFTYLDWGNPALQRVRRTQSDGTADGLWTEVYEDGLGREYKRVKEGGAQGSLTEETLYSDGSQRVWKKSLGYAAGETPRYTVFGFDGLGRMRTATNPDGTSGQRIYGNGFVRSIDETGREKVVWTDAYGKTTSVEEKVGATTQVTSYQYDLLGNLTRVTDAAGNLTTVTWDSLGRKLTGCDPDTGCSSYTYDDAGHITSYRDAKGQVSTYTYDALGRRLTKTLADGRLARWYYDEAGHGAGKGVLTSVTDPSGSESRSYDAAGRVTSLTKCVSGTCYTLAHGYDAAGRLSRITYPDGEIVNYGYDAAGRVQSVSGYVNGLTYNARSQLLTASYANGTTASYAYSDTRQWMTGATITGPAGTIYQASYGYDAGSRVTSTTSSTNPMSNLGYAYDALGRLTDVSGTQTHRYTYDALGNITSSAQLGGYQYGDAAHRHATTTVGTTPYAYDANGSLVSGGGRTLEWDTDNRLARVTTPSGATTFTYDADGQRVMKSGPSGTVRYFGPLVEHGPTGLTKYYYAGNLLVARRDAAGATWHHTDHLGSVRAQSNASGQKTASYDYAPFGAVVAASSSLAGNRGYGGHALDETGLVYMNARYYDPQLGRFVSADVVVPSSENPQALNRYAYVYNNPISNTDPTGHVPVVAAIATAFSVGIASGFTGAAFAISVVGAATVAAGYVLKDPLLTSLGSILLGAAGAYVFGAGFLGSPLSAQAAWVGGTVSALTSPISPLDPKLKQAIGWAYSAQSLLSDFRHLDERIDQGADRLGDRLSDSDRASILVQKQARLDSLSAQDKSLIYDPSRWTSAQRLYGDAVERATRGALTAGEAIALNPSGGLIGPGDGLLTQALEVTTGWIPGVRVHSVLHDAGGFLAGMSGFGVGPGYLYLGYNVLGLPKTLPLAGQLEGLAGSGGSSLNALFPRLF